MCASRRRRPPPRSRRRRCGDGSTSLRDRRSRSWKAPVIFRARGRDDDLRFARAASRAASPRSTRPPTRAASPRDPACIDHQCQDFIHFEVELEHADRECPPLSLRPSGDSRLSSGRRNEPSGRRRRAGDLSARRRARSRGGTSLLGHDQKRWERDAGGAGERQRGACASSCASAARRSVFGEARPERRERLRDVMAANLDLDVPVERRCRNLRDAAARERSSHARRGAIAGPTRPRAIERHRRSAPRRRPRSPRVSLMWKSRWSAPRRARRRAPRARAATPTTRRGNVAGLGHPWPARCVLTSLRAARREPPSASRVYAPKASRTCATDAGAPHQVRRRARRRLRPTCCASEI